MQILTPITIIILTNRDDQRFVDALNSAQFAKQIVVIDYKSHNDWENLGKKFRFDLKKSDQQKISDFAKERNSALKFAACDWVLFLDSDELIPEKSQLLIENLVKDNQCDGALIKRTDSFLGKILTHGETTQTKLLRIFKVAKGNFKRPVHEVAEVAGEILNSEIEIFHNSHLTISDFFSKVCNYAEIEANYRLDSRSGSPRNEMATTIFELNNYLQLLFFPATKFIFNYFFRLGLLDGWRGLIYAIMMSLHSLIVRVSLVEKMKNLDLKMETSN